MAITTAQKQVSFLHFHANSRNLPLPNGAYDQADHQTLLGRYGGVLWDEAAPVEELTGGVKARKVKYLDSEPLWKQKEKETDWIDEEIAKEKKKLTLHKPVIIDVKETIDAQIREIYTAQAVAKRIRKKRINKAMVKILMGM